MRKDTRAFGIIWLLWFLCIGRYHPYGRFKLLSILTYMAAAAMVALGLQLLQLILLNKRHKINMHKLCLLAYFSLIRTSLQTSSLRCIGSCMLSYTSPHNSPYASTSALLFRHAFRKLYLDKDRGCPCCAPKIEVSISSLLLQLSSLQVRSPPRWVRNERAQPAVSLILPQPLPTLISRSSSPSNID